MEINVWIQLFVRAVTSALNQFVPLNSQKNQSNGGALPNVPANAVDLTSTSKSAINPAQVPEKQPSIPLQIKRNPKMTTMGGVSGIMVYNGEQVCFTLENAADLIQCGTYSAQLDKSPHLGYVCPHLRVPERDLAAGGDAGLRVHVANFVSQLQGCVAVGLQPRPDCIEQSQAAFDKLMGVLPQTFTVEIC